MKCAGKARNNGLYRHIRTSKEIIRNLLNDYSKYTNVGSYSTAIANGMKKVKEYPDPKNEISYIYSITREEWRNLFD